MYLLALRLHKRGKTRLIHCLRLFWIFFVLWCEIGVFFWSLRDCFWPDHTRPKEDVSGPASSSHILLLADPQILDRNSYPGRSPLLMTLTEYIVDLNLRKSWFTILTKLEPQIVFVLGDMMDNGRVAMDAAEYTNYNSRFRSIFRHTSSIPTFFLPGNHDVDLGTWSHPSSKALARSRYVSHFAPVNQEIRLQNRTFLLIDAPGLVDEYMTARNDVRDWRESVGGTVEYLKHFVKNRSADPVVLLSHIPLFRPQHSTCGPLRESANPIRAGGGQGYENMLPREVSSYILETIRPDGIFSADDHDHCEYFHSLSNGSTIREITVRSLSMAMGIKRPGFQLMSVRSSGIADLACLLPDQIKIYINYYASAGLLTILLIFIINHQQYPRYPKNPLGIETLETPEQPQSVFMTQVLNSVTCKHRTVVGNGEEDQKTLPYDPPSDDMPSSEAEDDVSLPLHTQSALSKSRAFDSQARARIRTGVNRKGYRVWYIRAFKDFLRVAWPPFCLYILISLWFFRR